MQAVPLRTLHLSQLRRMTPPRPTSPGLRPLVLDQPQQHRLANSARKYINALPRTKPSYPIQPIITPSPKVSNEKSSRVQKRMSTSMPISKVQSHGLSMDATNPSIDEQDKILRDEFTEQSEVVARCIFGESFVNEARHTHREWIKHIDKHADYELDTNLHRFRLSNIAQKANPADIRHHMHRLYRQTRKLTLAEEAAVMATIIRILENIKEEPEQLQVGVGAMVTRILRESGLQALQHKDKVVKQVELHWRLMATRLKSKVKYGRRWEKVLGMASVKSHFMDLSNRESPLVQYLLRHCL